LSTKGKNNSEVSEQLVKFLHFVGANLAESTDDFEDALVKRLQDSVARIKASREMGERYMLFEELLKDEYSAGKAEGIAEGKAEGEAYGIVAGKIEDITELLSDIGTVSESLYIKLCSFTDAEQLRGLVKLAARTESVEAFEAELDSLLK
jgi:flagellar biosynthesis/type III secretory pathway protein FliH